MESHPHKKRHILTLVAAIVLLTLWRLGLLQAVVLTLCCVAGGGALLALITGTYTTGAALKVALSWLERRSAG